MSLIDQSRRGVYFDLETSSFALPDETRGRIMLVIQTHEEPLEVCRSAQNDHDVKYLMRTSPHIETTWSQSLGKSHLR